MIKTKENSLSFGQARKTILMNFILCQRDIRDVCNLKYYARDMRYNYFVDTNITLYKLYNINYACKYMQVSEAHFLCKEHIMQLSFCESN